MEVNLDGLRTSATKSMNDLAHEVESLSEFLPDWKYEELRDAYDDAARNVDLFNCVYNSNDDGFNDISQTVEVRKLVKD